MKNSGFYKFWSKNKISRATEGQVIKNISIDSKINEYKKWKELIDNVLQDFRKCDKTKLKIVEYKFFGNIPEDIIADELYVSKRGSVLNAIL